ncbi:MAG: hypothetical protein C0507_12240 [Cyanobacteria bacterium PR.3.49]|nr:hypothetical protein [Cyanobacteria bacterium PR.3.49]
MTNGTPPYCAHADGDDYPSVLTSETPPNSGVRHSDGRIECGGCGLVQPDNSSPGLKPSCSTCWAAIDVAENAANVGHVTPSLHRFAFPPDYSLIG